MCTAKWTPDYMCSFHFFFCIILAFRFGEGKKTGQMNTYVQKLYLVQENYVAKCYVYVYLYMCVYVCIDMCIRICAYMCMLIGIYISNI